MVAESPVFVFTVFPVLSSRLSRDACSLTSLRSSPVVCPISSSRSSTPACVPECQNISRLAYLKHLVYDYLYD